MPYFRPKTLSPSATYRPLPSLAIYRDAAVLSTAIDRGALSLSKGNALRADMPRPLIKEAVRSGPRDPDRQHGAAE